MPSIGIFLGSDIVPLSLSTAVFTTDRGKTYMPFVSSVPFPVVIIALDHQPFKYIEINLCEPIQLDDIDVFVDLMDALIDRA